MAPTPKLGSGWLRSNAEQRHVGPPKMRHIEGSRDDSEIGVTVAHGIDMIGFNHWPRHATKEAGVMASNCLTSGD